MLFNVSETTTTAAVTTTAAGRPGHECQPRPGTPTADRPDSDDPAGPDAATDLQSPATAVAAAAAQVSAAATTTAAATATAGVPATATRIPTTATDDICRRTQTAGSSHELSWSAELPERWHWNDGPVPASAATDDATAATESSTTTTAGGGRATHVPPAVNGAPAGWPVPPQPGALPSLLAGQHSAVPPASGGAQPSPAHAQCGTLPSGHV